MNNFFEEHWLESVIIFIFVITVVCSSWAFYEHGLKQGQEQTLEKLKLRGVVYTNYIREEWEVE